MHTLGIDVGTSATKVLLLRPDGQWEMHSWPSSEGVWDNLREWLDSPPDLPGGSPGDKTRFRRGELIGKVGITGHGPSAIIIRDGEVCGRIIPWHEPLPKGCERPVENDHVLPATRAWVPSRLAQWVAENGPIGDGVAVQLKDMLNWQLTGVVARDSRSMRGFSGDGGRSGGTGISGGERSEDYGENIGFLLPEEIIGRVIAQGSALSGIPVGVQVICGCDDLSAGVIGLDANNGDLFNLANTSEHVGLVGGEAQDGMSWLPALGRLPALCYLATSTGGRTLSDRFGEPASKQSVERFIKKLASSDENSEQWQALRELNEPIEKIRKQFPDGEMLIGGGLALIPQLVKTRGASLRAGQEVSVLGIAKLAEAPLAVIFGAGKVGRGFLAQLLMKAGWRIHFVDTNEQLINSLKSGEYHLYNLATGEVEKISGFSASCNEWRLEQADLILTSLGGNGLGDWAAKLAGFERGIDIILAENHPAPAALVREYIVSEKVGIAQAQVLRSCIEPTTEQIEEYGGLTVQIQDHWTLPLDADALRRPELLKSVVGFTPKSAFSIELTRKLYTYNCVNAMVCYLAKLAGYQWLADAANDDKIAELALAAGRESSAALVAAFGFDADVQQAWCKRALAKYQDKSIRDPVERNARDPIRKLGRYERLLGPIHLCLQYDLPHQNLMLGLAAALRYQESGDEAAEKLEKLVPEHGEIEALSLLSKGLDERVILALPKALTHLNDL